MILLLRLSLILPKIEKMELMGLLQLNKQQMRQRKNCTNIEANKDLYLRADSISHRLNSISLKWGFHSNYILS